MKKRIVSAVLGAAMVLSLAACGGGGSSAPATTAAAAGGETQAAAAGGETQAAAEAPTDAVTIEVWTEDRHDADYVQAMIDQYNQTNEDGIFINLTIISEDYANMVQLAIDGGTAPDVIGTNGDVFNNFVDTGLLVPLNSYIDADEEYQKVNEPYEHAYEGSNAKNGNIYQVWSGIRSGVRIEYNKDLLAASGFSEIPKTLDEYIDMAKKITEDGAGNYYGIGFTSSSPFERQLEMIAQVSGIYYYDYINGKFDFSGYKEILEKGRRFIDEGIAYPDQQGVDNMRALFAQGQFALWGNASQEAGVFTNQIPVEDFEWGVAEVPSLTGEIKGALQTTPSKGWNILSTSEHQDEAWKVIKFFQSEEFLKGYLEGGYLLPITKYMDGIIDKSKIGRMADFELLDYESVYPAPPIINLTGDDYRTVLWNAIMGYVDIDEAIEDLNTRYNEALDGDVAAGTAKRLVIADFDPMHPSQGTAQYLDK